MLPIRTTEGNMSCIVANHLQGGSSADWGCQEGGKEGFPTRSVYSENLGTHVHDESRNHTSITASRVEGGSGTLREDEPVTTAGDYGGKLCEHAYVLECNANGAIQIQSTTYPWRKSKPLAEQQFRFSPANFPKSAEREDCWPKPNASTPKPKTGKVVDKADVYIIINPAVMVTRFQGA